MCIYPAHRYLIVTLRRCDFYGPRQAAHDKAPANVPELFIFRQAATVPQALRDDASGRGRYVNPDPMPSCVLRGDERRATTAEGVQHERVRF